MTFFKSRCAAFALAALVAAGCHHAPPGDLPVIELPPARSGAPLAVVVSGDGGWRALDRHVAKGLHNRGYAVVGLNARQYFARRRSPEEASLALEKIITKYSAAWQTSGVIAVGYSRGAGVLPFMINRLPSDLRGTISLVALIGLDRTIDFYVTPFDLMRTQATSEEVPVRGEVEKLHGIQVLCVYGTNDEDNLCGELPESVVVHVREPGGHHMNVSHDELARTIWDYARSARGAR